MAERMECSFVPKTPPKPGFSIRACIERRQLNQFDPGTPPEPGFSIRAFVERNKLREKCAVCLETSSRTDFKTLGCNHRFHEHCLDVMLKNGQRTCPLCRANINDSWLQEHQMVFVSNVVDQFLDMWVEFISNGIERRRDNIWDLDPITEIDDDWWTIWLCCPNSKIRTF